MQFQEISREKAIRMDTQKLFQHIVPCLTKNKCSLNPHFFQTHVIIITSQKLNKCNGKIVQFTPNLVLGSGFSIRPGHGQIHAQGKFRR